jgi:hypothetical protein
LPLRLRLVGGNKQDFGASLVEVAVHSSSGLTSCSKSGPERQGVKQHVDGLGGVAERGADIFPDLAPCVWAVPAHKVDVESLGTLPLVVGAAAEAASPFVGEAVYLLSAAPAQQGT